MNPPSHNIPPFDLCKVSARDFENFEAPFFEAKAPFFEAPFFEAPNFFRI